MASGEYLELAQRAARAARFDPDDTTDLTRAKEAVNQAYLMAGTRDGIQFDFLEQEGQWSATAGSDVYTYETIGTAIGVSGASIVEILALTNDSDGTVLDSMSWVDLEKRTFASQDGESDGEPIWWAKWASRIRLFPNPDEDYVFGALVRLTPAELVDDTDEPLFPLAYRHSVIVSLAASILLRMEGGGEAHNEAQSYMREYESAWMAMRTAHSGMRPPTGSLKGTDWDRGFDDSASDGFWTRSW